MDLKIHGLTKEMIKEALEKTHKARIYILDEVMAKAIKEPRENLSEYAPKVFTMSVAVDKIRDVIGAGGKVVQKLCADYDVKIDIEEDGKIFVMGVDVNKCRRALEVIKTIVTDPQVGNTYIGKVVRIMDFGAFIEFSPGKEGLCHISQIDKRRINKVTDVLSEGQEVNVKIIEIDNKGRINLSMKDLEQNIFKN